MTNDQVGQADVERHLRTLYVSLEYIEGIAETSDEQLMLIAARHALRGLCNRLGADNDALLAAAAAAVC